MNDKENAFDLLRLILAFFVIITHAYLIGGYKAPDLLSVFSKGQTDFAEIGVMGFFALSGYLITASFERAKNILIFASHRILRIFPGYWVCILICAFIIAPLIFCLNGGNIANCTFTGNNSSVSYFFNNFFLIMRQWNIGNVLALSAYKGSLNGSLWTLFPELQCYMFTLIVGFFGLFNKNKVLYLILFVSVLCYFAIDVNFNLIYGPSFIVLGIAFKLYVSYMAGSIIYVYNDYFKFDVKGTIFSLLFFLVLLRFGGFHLISPLLVAIVLINGFRIFRVHLKYDISYGLYIYSFPVQQVLFLLVANKLPLIIFILLSFVISAGLAFLSYILVERPAMGLRKRTDPLLS